MLAVQVLILAILLLVVPSVVGLLFVNVGPRDGKLPFAWISGQILLWAGFQCICVPMILSQQKFSRVCLFFGIYIGIMVAAALLYYFLRGRKVAPLRLVSEKTIGKKSEYICWAVFGVLLVFQLVMAVCMAYEEGDDAYYVAMSTGTVGSDLMYDKIPYTGGYTGLDARHGLAQFPIWVAFLAKLSGMPAVTVAQIALPMVLIVMTYVLYYLIGKMLLKGHGSMLGLFMVFVELMVLFGGYSVYTAENFLLVRTAQGKSVIANLIFPFMFLLMYLLLEKVQKGEKLKGKLWLLVAFTMLSGCLCSTLGTLLTCLLLAVVGGCTAVCYRRWKLLIPMATCCLIPIGFAALYLLVG